jgi:hypothetical protein
MPAALTATAIVVALAAAVRSTWSPCGWSMLSTITPLTERGRGHRFAATAGWFVAGGVVGGTALGGLGALGATAVRATGASGDLRLWAAAVAAMVAAGFDLRALGPALPHHRRQVDERWLDEFRPWVYAGGFGLQIGAGLATYIMSAGVYLVVVLGALTASPPAAASLGAGFGLARGLAVLAGSANRTPERLAAFHRRFAAVEEPVRHAVGATLVAAAVVLGAAAGGAAGAVAVAAVLGGLVVVGRYAGGSMAIPARASSRTPASAERRASEPTTA